MLPSELKVDIAALVEPFVRAISEFAAIRSPSRLIASGVPILPVQTSLPVLILRRTASKTAVSFVIGNILD
jgi:hypothetical protein